MIKWINKKRNKKGFTLVELVVVIAILGILAAIAIPKLSGSRNTAKVATHNANVRTLKSTATMAIAENPDIESDELLGAVENLIDGKMPTPETDDDEFEVTLEDNGDITVSPGEVKVDKDGIIVEIDAPVVSP